MDSDASSSERLDDDVLVSTHDQFTTMARIFLASRAQEAECVPEAHQHTDSPAMGFPVSWLSSSEGPGVATWSPDSQTCRLHHTTPRAPKRRKVMLNPSTPPLRTEAPTPSGPLWYIPQLHTWGKALKLAAESLVPVEALAGHLYRRVAARYATIEGGEAHWQHMQHILLAGCLWLAAKLEDRRSDDALSSVAMGLCCHVPAKALRATELHICELLDFKLLDGWCVSTAS